jgi:hypothetical protein
MNWLALFIGLALVGAAWGLTVYLRLRAFEPFDIEDRIE